MNKALADGVDIMDEEFAEGLEENLPFQVEKIKDGKTEDKVMFERASKFVIDMNYHHAGKPLQRLIEKVESKWLKTGKKKTKKVQKNFMSSQRNSTNNTGRLISRYSSLGGGAVHKISGCISTTDDQDFKLEEEIRKPSDPDAPDFRLILPTKVQSSDHIMTKSTPTLPKTANAETEVDQISEEKTVSNVDNY